MTERGIFNICQNWLESWSPSRTNYIDDWEQVFDLNDCKLFNDYYCESFYQDFYDSALEYEGDTKSLSEKQWSEFTSTEEYISYHNNDRLLVNNWTEVYQEGAWHASQEYVTNCARKFLLSKEVKECMDSGYVYRLKTRMGLMLFVFGRDKENMQYDLRFYFHKKSPVSKSGLETIRDYYEYEDFDYPKEYYKLSANNLYSFGSWYIMEIEDARLVSDELQDKFPERDLIPFASREWWKSGEVACFEIGKENKVEIIDRTSDDGFEQIREYDSFGDWLRAVIDEMLEEQ